MKTIAILSSFVLAGCLGDTTPRSIPGVQPDKGVGILTAPPPRTPPVRGPVADVRTQVAEQLGLPAHGTAIALEVEADGTEIYKTVTAFAGGGGETCEVSARDGEILAVSCEVSQRLEAPAVQSLDGTSGG
jgi:hypothetical protein